MSQNSTSPREEVGRAGCAWLPLWERYDKLCSARVVPLQPHTRERATVVTCDTYRGCFEQGELSSYFFSAAVVSWRKKIFYNLSPKKNRCLRVTCHRTPPRQEKTCWGERAATRHTRMGCSEVEVSPLTRAPVRALQLH